MDISKGSYKLVGKAVIKGEIVNDAAIVVTDGIIKYAGVSSDATACDNVLSYDGLIVPGFIDIHCHAGNGCYVQENPEVACGYHLEHGTTTMCTTMYRNIEIDDMLKGCDKIMNAKLPNVYGVHLEGPYLNPIYGSKSDGIEIRADRNEYLPLLDHPFVKHVTYAPEVKGTDMFLKDMVDRGILVSVGHSSASAEEVDFAVKGGAKNITHLFDATGASITPTRWVGTIEVDFNAAALLQDDVTYEIICDKRGLHVRHELIRLTAKIVGVDKIIGITDCCGANSDESDVFFENGEIAGSNLTMNQAFRNLLSVGFSTTDVVKMTSTNAAKLLGLSDKIGTIDAGKYGDLVVLDNDCNVVEVFKSSISYNL